jgi:hypothetical protein
MKKFVLPLAAALLFAAAGSAHAGKIYFTAYKDGKQTAIKADRKAKMPAAAAQIEVVTQTAYDKMSAAKKKNYSAVDKCGEKYYLTKKAGDWIKAHEDAKHDIHVRDNVKRGQYKVVCPKEAAAPPPGDKKKTQ